MTSKTRSDLVSDLAKRFPLLSQADVKTATDTILDAITNALATGERVEVRGFGSFSLTHKAPRTGRNPRTGEAVQVPAKSVPHFKTGKELRERVDL